MTKNPQKFTWNNLFDHNPATENQDQKAQRDKKDKYNRGASDYGSTFLGPGKSPFDEETPRPHGNKMFARASETPPKDSNTGSQPAVAPVAPTAGRRQ